MDVDSSEVTERLRSPWPLVGRSSALTRCRRVIDRGQSIVVAGEAGIGKTRLAAELRATLHERGWVVRHVVATSATGTLPLGALSTLVAEIPGLADLTPQVLHATMRQLAPTDPGAPVLISVDDAHHLDDLSVALLRQLATAGDAILLLTVRSTEPAPSDLVELWKDGAAARVELAPLGRSELLSVVEQVLGAPLVASAAHELWRLTGGNALHARELLAAVADEGALRWCDRGWELDRIPAGAQRLVELVDHRLHQLDTPLREVMELVAAADGGGLTLFIDLGVGAELAVLERRGLVMVVESGDRRPVMVTHPLHGEVLRAAMPRSRRAALRSRVADAVVARGARRSDDPLMITTWAMEDGVAPDAGLALRAAQSAFARHDHQTAERIGRLVVATTPSDEARWLVGLALEAQGRAGEADGLFAAVDIAALSDEALLRHVVHRAENLFWLGRTDDAHAVLRSAEVVSVEPVVADRLRAAAASFALLEGSVIGALEHLQPDGTELDTWLEDPSTAAGAGVTVAAPALVLGGRPMTALRLTEAGVEHRSGTTDRLAVQDLGVLLAVRSFARTELGALEEAVDDARVGHELAMGLRLSEGHALFALYRGRADLVAGRAQAALESFDEAASLFARTRLAAFERWSRAGMAWALSLVGNSERAGALSAELAGHPPSAALMMEPETMRALAAVAAASGDLDQARAHLDAGAALAASMGASTHALAIAHDRIRYALAGPADLAALDALAVTVEGPLARARQRHGRALARDDGAGLLTAGEDFERCGALLLAAEATADAARSLFHAGRNEAARAASDRVGSLRKTLDPVTSPGMALPRVPVHLTAREREVAVLTAAGCSTRGVAEQLVVSPRTVENHLHRVYAKLGISGRSELADALGITVTAPGAP